MSEMTFDGILEHYGVKGMKWGVRKKRSTAPVEVSTSQAPGRRVKAKGGENQPAHPDAIKVATSKQKAKKSSLDSLSTKDLQEMVLRMNLEAQYNRLNPPTGSAAAKAFLSKQLNQIGQREAMALAQGQETPLVKKIKDAMK